MTTGTTHGRGEAVDPLPGDGDGARLNVVPDMQERRRGPVGVRCVNRPTETLRPHPVYRELCAPVAAARMRHVAQQAQPFREPLLTMMDGTILDGYARWQVALERQQPALLCIQCDVTEEEGLELLIQRHRTSGGLNAYCRIVLALGLEPHVRAPGRRSEPATSGTMPSSNLTNREHRDARKALARMAGVSTGNVTKVKQLSGSVIPEVRERLLRGEVSIHRAWQWRTLSARAQRDALWEHLYRPAMESTVRRLVRAHSDARTSARPVDVPATVLTGLALCDTADVTVVVVDLPGRAVVVTRACYDGWREKTAR